MGTELRVLLANTSSLFTKMYSQTCSNSVLKQVKKKKNLVNENNSISYSYKNTVLFPWQTYKTLYRFRLFSNVNQNNNSLHAHAHLKLFARTDLGKKNNQFLFSQMEQKLKWRQFIYILSLPCFITSFNIFAIHKTPSRLCGAREKIKLKPDRNWGYYPGIT